MREIRKVLNPGHLCFWVFFLFFFFFGGGGGGGLCMLSPVANHLEKE